ncbi:hypothetical protein NVP1111B_59 [Vibrio phage 1.111.B._10N.286.45.E6]|nr:hypothetical protein NVP1111A_59 [Vibrio phage 1.111.A._10N.286.45.E6]AUR88315.1 hypothetical protein NVP1111B_59 [Vibrio phage 1.111.B._10N.286.45.E6]
MTPETAVRQATITAEEYADSAINFVSESGKLSGYSSHDKALIIAAMITASAMDFETSARLGLIDD